MLTDFPSPARAIRVEKRDKATDIIWTGIACQSIDVGIPDVESHANCIICVEVSKWERFGKALALGSGWEHDLDGTGGL